MRFSIFFVVVSMQKKELISAKVEMIHECCIRRLRLVYADTDTTNKTGTDGNLFKRESVTRHLQK